MLAQRLFAAAQTDRVLWALTVLAPLPCSEDGQRHTDGEKHFFLLLEASGR